MNAGSGPLTAALPAGLTARVRVPATCGNVGPGFDSVGIAMARYDEVSLTTLADPEALEVEVTGQGAADVPRTGHHLVVRAARAALTQAGVTAGLRLSCDNGIAHGRGLGSSAAAVVAGAMVAQGLLVEAGTLVDVDRDALLALAHGFEGHPDNAAPALWGGLALAWTTGTDEPQGAGVVRAVRVSPHPDLVTVLAVPVASLSTRTARAALPAQVPHADAAFNAGRSALLVEAVTRRPDLLLAATADRLHQAQRASVMPATAAVVAMVRSRGFAAVVSGAGPSVLVLTTRDAADQAREALEAATRENAAGAAGEAWQVDVLEVDPAGARLLRADDVVSPRS